MADALDVSLIQITATTMWQYERLPHDIYPVVMSEIRLWCDEEFGKNRVVTVVREVRVRREEKLYNTYRVFLRFPDEASAVHFRLRWGGHPVTEMPANRSLISE